MVPAVSGLESGMMTRVNVKIFDFTESHYRKLLKLALDRYRFVSFSEALSLGASQILWRHDIDYSPHRALKLARIEQAMGVRATYFVQLGSPFYNLLEQDVLKKICAILRLGHRVGLHFDPGAHEDKHCLAGLKNEKNILEKIIGVPVGVFSLHNPEPKHIHKFFKLKYAGMINVYAKSFFKNFYYCSDSNGYWRHDRLFDLLKSGKEERLHVLTHPGWWQHSAMSPCARMERCWRERMRNQSKNYERLLKKSGRTNVK